METRIPHLLLTLLLPMTTLAAEIPFYIGTYTNTPDPATASRGIYRSTLNTETGALSAPVLAAETDSPSYLALTRDQKFLYAVNEPKHTVTAFRVESNGLLTRLNSQPTGGNSPAHVSLDATNRIVLVANYTGGSVATFPIQPDGSLGERAAFIQLTGSGPDPKRQTAPHAHSIYTSPDNQFAYVCDLGTDKIWIFHFDAKTGALTPADPAFATVPAGGGPRHMAFAPTAPFAYANNEMALTVTALSLEASHGTLTPRQTLSSLPEGVPTAGSGSAAIRLHPNGKWLYVANRGHDSITQYGVGSDGQLTWIDNVPHVPTFPRDFTLDPSGKFIVVAGQKGNGISTYKINPQSGKLTPAADSITVSAPVAVLFGTATP